MSLVHMGEQCLNIQFSSELKYKRNKFFVVVAVVELQNCDIACYKISNGQACFSTDIFVVAALACGTKTLA